MKKNFLLLVALLLSFNFSQGQCKFGNPVGYWPFNGDSLNKIDTSISFRPIVFGRKVYLDNDKYNTPNACYRINGTFFTGSVLVGDNNSLPINNTDYNCFSFWINGIVNYNGEVIFLIANNNKNTNYYDYYDLSINPDSTVDFQSSTSNKVGRIKNGWNHIFIYLGADIGSGHYEIPVNVWINGISLIGTNPLLVSDINSLNSNASFYYYKSEFEIHDVEKLDNVRWYYNGTSNDTTYHNQLYTEDSINFNFRNISDTIKNAGKTEIDTIHRVAGPSCVYDSIYIYQGDVSTNTKNIESNKDINVYPNPSNGDLIISINESNNWELQIFNSLGEIVSDKIYNNTSLIKLFNLKSGIFFIKLSNKDNSQILRQKLIVY